MTLLLAQGFGQRARMQALYKRKGLNCRTVQFGVKARATTAAGPLSCNMTSTGMNTMSKITFYEERNFQGRSYECVSDCPDMSSVLSRCHSCRVERGCFMVYDRKNYMGNQYLLRRGDYADYMSMMGMSDCIRSCRMISMHRGSSKMRIYERENFSGQMHELREDCENISDHARMSSCMSCNVLEGDWLLFEQPHFRGRMMYVRTGEYKSFQMPGMTGVRFTSVKRITESCI